MTNVLAVLATVFYIYEMVQDEMSIVSGIGVIVIFWLLTIAVNCVGVLGESLGGFLISLGETLTDWALELLTL